MTGVWDPLKIGSVSGTSLDPGPWRPWFLVSAAGDSDKEG